MDILHLGPADVAQKHILLGGHLNLALRGGRAVIRAHLHPQPSLNAYADLRLHPRDHTPFPHPVQGPNRIPMTDPEGTLVPSGRSDRQTDDRREKSDWWLVAGGFHQSPMTNHQ